MKGIRLLIAIFFVSILAGSALAACQPYAFEGAYARYTFNENTAIGSFSGEIKYEITKVWCSNSTMMVKITTSGSTPGMMSGKHTDDINDPEYFPAVPMKDLGKKTILWSGRTYDLIETKGIEVSAGAFTVYHYRYKDNDETHDVFLDTSTGLLVKSKYEVTTFGVKTTVNQELYDTNIYGTSMWLILFVVLAIVGAILAVIIAVIMRQRRNRGYIQQQQQTQQYYPQQYSQGEEEFVEPRQ